MHIFLDAKCLLVPSYAIWNCFGQCSKSHFLSSRWKWEVFCTCIVRSSFKWILHSNQNTSAFMIIYCFGKRCCFLIMYIFVILIIYTQVQSALFLFALPIIKNSKWVRVYWKLNTRRPLIQFQLLFNIIWKGSINEWYMQRCVRRLDVKKGLWIYRPSTQRCTKHTLWTVTHRQASN